MPPSRSTRPAGRDRRPPPQRARGSERVRPRVRQSAGQDNTLLWCGIFGGGSLLLAIAVFAFLHFTREESDRPSGDQVASTADSREENTGRPPVVESPPQAPANQPPAAGNSGGFWNALGSAFKPSTYTQPADAGGKQGENAQESKDPGDGIPPGIPRPQGGGSGINVGGGPPPAAPKGPGGIPRLQGQGGQGAAAAGLGDADGDGGGREQGRGGQGGGEGGRGGIPRLQGQGGAGQGAASAGLGDAEGGAGQGREGGGEGERFTPPAGYPGMDNGGDGDRRAREGGAQGRGEMGRGRGETQRGREAGGRGDGRNGRGAPPRQGRGGGPVLPGAGQNDDGGSGMSAGAGLGDTDPPPTKEKSKSKTKKDNKKSSTTKKKSSGQAGDGDNGDQQSR